MARWQMTANRWVGAGEPCFIIAEIGQNHQGDINIAKQLMKESAEAGADCVKFQKSTIEERYNKKCLERPYNTPNSWGPTYGEHKRYLEFSKEEFIEMKKYAEEELKVVFSASAWDLSAADFLYEIGCPFFKVPSPDFGNLRLVEHMAEKKIPMVVSTGMQDMTTVREVYGIISKHHKNFAFLQCTSSYPVTPENVNLNVLKTYQQEFPDIPVGYSGHESGMSISLAAVAMGAKVLERHVTLDKTWRGSDHAASLDMNEFRQMVKEIRLVEAAFGSPNKHMLPGEEPFKKKLGKSVVTTKKLAKHHVIKEGDIMVKNAEPIGIPPQNFNKLIGSTVLEDYDEDETLDPKHVQYGDIKLDKKFVALILARGGSKGVPKKNIKECAGKPLLAWTLLAIQKANVFDEIWVSTDSEEIGEVATQYGAKFHKRSAYAARDEASSAESCREFIHKHPEVWACAMFQCTVPAQFPDLITQAYNYIHSDTYDAVFSVTRSHRFRWTEIKAPGQVTVPLNIDPAKRPRRQDWAGDVVESGAFYFFKRLVMEETGHYQALRVGYVEDPTEDVIDIDTPADFKRVEMVIRQHAKSLGLVDETME